VSADADGGFDRNQKTKDPLVKGGNEGGFVKQKNIITEKVYRLDQNLNIHETAIQYDQADKILLKARDEAHRFANVYRKKQMSSTRVESSVI